MGMTTAENPRSIFTLAGLAAGLVLSGPALYFAGPCFGVVLEKTTLISEPQIQLCNSTAHPASTSSLQVAEPEMESPNFVPPELEEFVANGFVRRNRWS